MYVLIPSAKLVETELQRLGKLPPVIYPINDGIVFDILWKQYKDVADSFEIVCYENAQKVHRRLANYPADRVRIHDLEQLNDLGHTVYYGLRDEHIPVLINFGDTIVYENIIAGMMDTFYYAEEYVSELWTYFQMENGQITKVTDKQSTDMEMGQKGTLFVGVFYISDSGCLRRCLEEAFTSSLAGVSAFYRALMLYSKQHALKAIRTQNWFDIGHEERYYNSKLEVDARIFNHITIDINRGILTKTSDDYEKFKGEIRWHLKLPSTIEYVRPRIFDYSTSNEGAFISMEYYSYHTLHELFLYGDLKYNQWVDIFERVHFVCDDFGKYTVKDAGINDALEEMYLSKTEKRLALLRDSALFAPFFNGEININNVYYPSLDVICQILKTEIPARLYDVDQFRIIHGDLCFANIMVDSNFNFVKLIDPRGKFGKYDIYGDYRYDLAKLYHSIHGKYDFIIKDLFTIEADTDRRTIRFTIHDRRRDYDLFTIFQDIFHSDIGDSGKKIELIEALLFLSMVPLHTESPDQQMVMLATGIEILGKVLDIGRPCAEGHSRSV